MKFAIISLLCIGAGITSAQINPISGLTGLIGVFPAINTLKISLDKLAKAIYSFSNEIRSNDCCGVTPSDGSLDRIAGDLQNVARNVRALGADFRSSTNSNGALTGLNQINQGLRQVAGAVNILTRDILAIISSGNYKSGNFSAVYAGLEAVASALDDLDDAISAVTGLSDLLVDLASQLTGLTKSVRDVAGAVRTLRLTILAALRKCNVSTADISQIPAALADDNNELNDLVQTLSNK